MDNRMPKQKRSLAKRNKIITKGFELMCENGYYKTTTSDIAKYCDISVGIIYQYFNDKKEIFIEGVKNYSQSIMFPMIEILEKKAIDFNNIDKEFNNLMDIFIKKHLLSKKAHEELQAMSHLDEEIGNIIKFQEMELTDKLVETMEINNIKIKNAKEKIHIIIGVVENLCHEIIYHHHKNLDYDVMKDEVIKLIKNTLK